MSARAHFLFALAAVFASAAPVSAAEKKPKVLPKTGTVDASGAYQMSADELALDCKRLTGTMKVRILQIRDYDPSRKPSAIGNALQSMHSPLIQGSKRGMDPAAEHQADLAMLKAYNQRLAEKKCRTVDIEAELKAQPAASSPHPQGASPAPSAAKK